MALLKKIKGATLIETIVASVVILTSFIFATVIINNVFYSAVVNDTFEYTNRIKEIHYLAKHKQLTIPFYEDTPEWEITVEGKDKTVILLGNFKRKEMITSITLQDD